jgi:signal transduction histidine kinase
LKTIQGLTAFILFWCSLFTCHPVLGSDSAEINSGSEEIDRLLDYYDQLCDKAVKTKSDTSLQHVQTYLSTQRKNHIANAHFYLAKYYMISGSKTNVAENFFESLRIYEELKDTMGVARLHLALARLNQQEQNYIEAINYYNNSHRFYEQIGNSHSIHHTLNELGTLYYRLQEFEQAQYYFLQALKSNIRFGQIDKAASSVNNIALAYANLNKRDKALEAFKVSLKISRLSHNEEMLANVLGNIGRLYKKAEKNDSAMFYISASLSEEKKIRNIENTIICYIDLGEMLLDKNNFDSGRAYVDTAMLLLESHPFQSLQLRTLRLMSDYYRQKEDYNQAFLYLSRFQSINDSIALAEKQQLAQGTRLRLALQTKDKEIKELTANVNAQEEKLSKGQITLNLLSIVSAILLLLTGMAINRAIKKSRINQELEELNRERNTLMTMVSHDLKSPLASLQGMLNLLESESNNLTADQKKYMQYMGEIIQNSNDMIKNVIDLGRVYEQNLRINQTSFEIRHTIERIVNQFIAAAAKKNIRIDFVNDSKNDLIKADESMLRRIMENLVSNALKFSPLNSDVKIVLSNPSSNTVCIGVYDRGPGISPDEQTKLFQKFQRLSAVPTGNETSSGLGLYIVKELVDKNNGQISYQLNPGGGSIFSVSLPLA